MQRFSVILWLKSILFLTSHWEVRNFIWLISGTLNPDSGFFSQWRVIIVSFKDRTDVLFTLSWLEFILISYGFVQELQGCGKGSSCHGCSVPIPCWHPTLNIICLVVCQSLPIQSPSLTCFFRGVCTLATVSSHQVRSGLLWFSLPEFWTPWDSPAPHQPFHILLEGKPKFNDSVTPFWYLWESWGCQGTVFC